MKKKIDFFINETHNNCACRESIEWSNFWYSAANENARNRVLLIGDSTARMVRSKLESLCGIPVEKLDWNIDNVTKRKNDIIKEIAVEYNIDYFDINQYMLNLNQSFISRVSHIDHIHFEDKGKVIIANEYCKLNGSNESSL